MVSHLRLNWKTNSWHVDRVNTILQLLHSGRVSVLSAPILLNENNRSLKVGIREFSLWVESLSNGPVIISRADQRNAAYVCFSERIGQYKLYKGRWKIAISIFGRAVKVCLKVCLKVWKFITPEKCRERALPIDPRMILNCFGRVVHIWTIQTM